MSRISPHTAMREDAHDLFHDYWQLFTALKTYVNVLEHSPRIIDEDKVAVEELSQMLRRLEEHTEALRARVLAMIG